MPSVSLDDDQAQTFKLPHNKEGVELENSLHKNVTDLSVKTTALFNNWKEAIVLR